MILNLVLGVASSAGWEAIKLVLSRRKRPSSAPVSVTFGWRDGDVERWTRVDGTADAVAETIDRMRHRRHSGAIGDHVGMTWTAPDITRTPAPDLGDERTMLEGWLDHHRQTLLRKCAGLTAEQLKTASVEPSGLTLLGLVRHMADVERWWFRKNFLGEDVPDLYYTHTDIDADFNAIADADAEADFAIFQREVELCRAAVAGHSLDETYLSLGRKRREQNLRWVYVHMIEEYARHNGHADLIRERIDGVTGD